MRKLFIHLNQPITPQPCTNGSELDDTQPGIKSDLIWYNKGMSKPCAFFFIHETIEWIF